MKKHSFLLSFCSVLSIFVLLHVLFSCSNKEAQTEDVSEAEASEIISEEGSTDSPTDTSIEANSSEKKDAQMSELESTIGADDSQEPETSLGDAPAESGSEMAATSDKAPTEDSLGSISAADESEDNQTSLSDLNQSTASEPAPTVEEGLGSAETITEPSGEVPQQPIAKQSKPRHAGTPQGARHASGGGAAKAPTIPGKAFQTNGALLNRFYFARQGDNAKKVSQLLYGDATHAKALTQWNKGGFGAGKLVFYSSPVNPADEKMQSFYQERQIPFDTYTVGPKESLGSIAKKKLGANASWKEIAVLNGLEKYNSATTGQKLEINPKDLAAAAASAPKQNVPTPVPQPTQVAQATPAPNVGEPPPLVDAPKPAHNNPAPSASADMDYGNLLTQNLFPIVVGAAVLVFLVLLIAIGKRKKKTPLSDDFPEDGFSAPPKLKKRK